MYKKYLSGILALGMSMALVPVNVRASRGLNIKAFNATRTAITVDFAEVDGDIDESTLEDRIIVKKRSAGGEIIELQESEFDFIVSERQKGKKNDADVVTAEGNTVIITPVRGVDTNCLYNVEFSQGVSDSAGTLLNQKESTGWFKVNEIFKEDFNVEFASDGAPEYPYYLNTTATGLRTESLESEYWNASYRKDFTCLSDGSNSTTVFDKFQLRNNNQYVYLNATGFPEEKRTNDYTVEAELGLPKSMNKSVEMYIRNSSTSVSNGY